MNRANPNLEIGHRAPFIWKFPILDFTILDFTILDFTISVPETIREKETAA